MKVRAPRTWEGRLLARQDEEVVDQGLQFDVVTLLNRRQIVGVLGMGVVSLGLAACTTGGGSSSSATGSAASGSNSSGEIPDETAGPFPGDGSNGPDALEQSGIVRSDIRSSFGTSTTTAEGVPMTLTLTVTDLAKGGAAFAGVAVYVWHCDRSGAYSMYSDGVTEENYLRGVQVADAEGKVRFTSIFPACYSGRWPHVHFEVYPSVDDIADSANVIATSQVALPEAACAAVYATAGYEQSASNLARTSLDGDNVFGDDGGTSQLATVTGAVAQGYAVALTVPVDTRTEPTGGGAPGGSGPGA